MDSTTPDDRSGRNLLCQLKIAAILLIPISIHIQ
jgi:hypothetical protein